MKSFIFFSGVVSGLCMYSFISNFFIDDVTEVNVTSASDTNINLRTYKSNTFSRNKQNQNYENEISNNKLSFDKNEIHCLALTVYGEAADQEYSGKVAVAATVINRVKRGFSNTACNVVTKKFAYSPFNNPSYYRLAELSKSGVHIQPNISNIIDEEAWLESVNISKRMYYGQESDNTNGATHFISFAVLKEKNMPIPSWVYDENAIVTAKYGDHTFFNGI